MNRLSCFFSLLIITVLPGTALAGPITYDGITFPDGDISFADEVISFSPGPDVAGDYLDSTDVLGAPDGDAASLGDFGELIVKFTNNSLTASGDATPDLHIFEIGAVTEWMNVAISTDNINYIEIADALGQPTSIDIDAISEVTFGVQYSYVRLRDILPNQTGSPYGEADIDAIGAISSAPPAPVPEPAAISLLLMALLFLVACRRRNAMTAARATDCSP